MQHNEIRACAHQKHIVAADILRVARMYNNILYKNNYHRYGAYSDQEVASYFGSFDDACRALKIINPEDPYDLTEVLKDIRFVLKDQKKITQKIYEDNGIYTLPALKKRYGSFNDLIILARSPKPAPQITEPTVPERPVYPKYNVIQEGKNVRLRWIHNA